MKVLLRLFSLFLTLNTLTHAMDDEQLQNLSIFPKTFAKQIVEDIQTIQSSKTSPLIRTTDTQEISYTKDNFLVMSSLVLEIRAGNDEVINKFIQELEDILGDSNYNSLQNWTLEYFSNETDSPVRASLADPG